MSAYKRIKLKNMGKFIYTFLPSKEKTGKYRSQFLVVLRCFCCVCVCVCVLFLSMNSDRIDNDDENSSLTLSFRHISLLVAARGGAGY